MWHFKRALLLTVWIVGLLGWAFALKAQEDATPQPSPSLEIQRDQLLKDTAQLRADVIAMETRLHVCEATSEARQHTIESMQLTERVTASISELRRANPGAERPDPLLAIHL